MRTPGFEEAITSHVQLSLEHTASARSHTMWRLCSAVVGLHVSGTAVSAVCSRVSVQAPCYAATAGDARLWHQHALGLGAFEPRGQSASPLMENFTA